MARIRRILETALDCDDLETSAKFYRRLLAVEPMLTSDRLVAIDAGEGTVLLLFQRGSTSTPVELPGGVIPPHDSGGPGHLAFAIDADQLAAWETRCHDLAIAIESRVVWERGGTSLYFRDPDGRSIELVTPGLSGG